MLDFNGKSVCVVGYGNSNKAVVSYLLKKGIFPTVRTEKMCEVPRGIKIISGDGYLQSDEDIIFRSPGIRPDKISGKGRMLTESAFTLSLLNSHKIGITGSDGKSTTSTLIHKILQLENTSYLGGNIGTSLLEFAEELLPDDFAVMELSSFQLMDDAPALDVAVITNITQNHLDWHTSMDEYISAKKNILKNARVSVLNYDDPILRAFARNGTVFTTLCDMFDILSKNKNKNYTFVYPHNGYIYCNKDKIAEISKILLKGEHNLKNALSAVGATYNFASPEAQKEVLYTFSGIECRMEKVKTVGGVSFFNSSIDSTPSRTAATISAFDKSETVIILGGYDKNLDYDMLAPALDGLKAAVLCGENKNKILGAIKNAKIGTIAIENSFENCVKTSYKLANGQGCVLLSPASASFDMFENYRHRANKFKEIINELERQNG